jgi:hypothetical protein
VTRSSPRLIFNARIWRPLRGKSVVYRVPNPPVGAHSQLASLRAAEVEDARLVSSGLGADRHFAALIPKSRATPI